MIENSSIMKHIDKQSDMNAVKAEREWHISTLR